MEGSQIENIVHAGVVFAVFLFIAILVYFTLSSPIDAIMDGLESDPPEDSQPYVTEHYPNLDWAIKAAFALGIATPATWFIMWIFAKEPFVGYKRRY